MNERGVMKKENRPITLPNPIYILIIGSIILACVLLFAFINIGMTAFSTIIGFAMMLGIIGFSKLITSDTQRRKNKEKETSMFDIELFKKAVNEDDAEMLKNIIKDFEQINDLFFHGVTLLHFAACSGSINVLKALLSAGAKYDIEYSGGNKAPVVAMLSCETNAEPILSTFLDAGVNPNMRGYQQNTLLIEASFSGKTSCVRLLLNHGADINAINIKGNSALISAAKNGFKETVKLLLEKGADTSITGISMPQESEQKAPWGEIYVEGKKMYESNDSAGSTAAVMAAKRKLHDIARLINAVSCIKGPRDRRFIEIVDEKNSELIKELVQKEKLTKSQGLICCACNMHLGSVKYMIEKGANNLEEAFNALLKSGEPSDRDKNNAITVLNYLDFLLQKKPLN